MSDEIYTGSSNPKVNILTKQLLSTSKPASSSRSDRDEDDEDAIFAELEAELENDDEALREHALKGLQREMTALKQMREDMHGKYSEIDEEKEVIRVSASERRCIIHFYHSNFRRCAIMDKHLATIAPKYFGTRIIRVFVEKVPFLVEKLGIKVLPCVICFVDGVTKDRIVGFEDLGNKDSFSTATLELRLQQIGVIQKETKYIPAVRNPTTAFAREGRVRQQRYDDGDDEFDLD
ncbi:thioredoxin-like protein [Auriscalpium vulgare]|uniref:Thioredoxin-like protein n=1 Tax=Auriscalpium vulgare TaxID=40419 RepID=A0ACB8S8Q1_9AGAM|nr:thioredoxin-like protein [Auriscalpium vulgare]